MDINRSPGRAVAIVMALAVAAPVLAQEAGRLSGTVVLESTGETLHGVRVLIPAIGRSVLSTEDGTYAFDGVPAGTYEVLAVREHLQATRVTVEVSDGESAVLDLVLRFTPVHEEVTVTASGREQTAFDAFNSVQVLDSIELAENLAINLGEQLEGEPGVAKRSFGPGSSRPIIRGFDNDRVLITQDGTRSGDLGSQSGDHGVSIDPGSLQKVEILKGPATLLYGSSAIGGVINTETPQQQFYEDPPSELRGGVTVDMGTTNEQAGGSGNFQWGNGEMMLWFGGGGRRTGSYNTPEGTVENSQTEQLSGRFGIGWFGDKAWVSAGYNIEDGRYGVPLAGDLYGEAEGEDGHGAILRFRRDEEDHEEALIELDYRRQVVRVDGGARNIDSKLIDSVKAVLSYVDWKHEEVENFVDTGESEIGTVFSNKHYVGRLEVQQRTVGRLTGQFGLWGQHRDYVATGEEALAPPTKQSAFAGFAYEELLFDRWSLQLGARLEHNQYRPEDSPDREPQAPAVKDRSFTGLSASVGARVPFADNRFALVGNLTSAYRAPALEELYNFGPHVGNLAFEIGNPDLGAERSNGGELSVRYNSGEWNGNLNFFYYGIDDFIFGAPTGAIRDGLVEVIFAQGDSRFVGFDLSIHFHLRHNLHMILSGAYVDAQLTDTDEPLPRIPPLSGRLAFDWRPHNRWRFQPTIVVADEQDRVFTNEQPTEGYLLLDLLAQYTIPTGKTMHVFTLNFSNLADELYRNHSSFIKEFAPEMGRRVLFTYALRLF